MIVSSVLHWRTVLTLGPLHACEMRGTLGMWPVVSSIPGDGNSGYIQGAHALVKSPNKTGAWLVDWNTSKGDVISCHLFFDTGTQIVQRVFM